MFEWEWTPNAQWYQVDYFPCDRCGSNYLHLLSSLCCILLFGLLYYWQNGILWWQKESYITARRAEMQTKWRSIMGILKDHMSYMLVPEMKVSTDTVAAYTLKIINHLPKCCEIQNKNLAFLMQKTWYNFLFFPWSVTRCFLTLSVFFNIPKENCCTLGFFNATILFAMDGEGHR